MKLRKPGLAAIALPLLLGGCPGAIPGARPSAEEMVIPSGVTVVESDLQVPGFRVDYVRPRQWKFLVPQGATVSFDGTTFRYEVSQATRYMRLEPENGEASTSMATYPHALLTGVASNSSFVSDRGVTFTDRYLVGQYLAHDASGDVVATGSFKTRWSDW